MPQEIQHSIKEIGLLENYLRLYLKTQVLEVSQKLINLVMPISTSSARERIKKNSLCRENCGIQKSVKQWF